MVVTPYAGNPIWNFLGSNIYLIMFLALIGFIAYQFFKFSTKKPKIISRSMIEKQKRIDELMLNNRIIPENETVFNYETQKEEKVDTKFYEYKWLQHGNRLLGSIQNIGKKLIEGNPDNKEFYEIVFKPSLLGRISNPIKKEIIIVFKEDMYFFKKDKCLVIKHEVSIDKDMGVFFTTPHQEEILNLINEHLYKVDKEQNASFYFVESQKRATFDLDYAHAMAMREKELQIELAKKRGKMTSI